MDNAQKAIMIGVGLFVTILIIAAVMLIVNPAIDMIRNLTGQVEQLSASMQARLTAEYDDRSITGSAVKSAIQQFYQDESMVLEVKATSSANYLEYAKVRGNGTLVLDQPLKYDSSNVQSKIGKLDDTSDMVNCVSTNARYRAELIRNASGDTVMGIRFTKEGN